MEALEPVLKQKFWILLGIGLIMTFAGWWMATGQISAAITERTTKIENAEKSIPAGDVPNEIWTKRLAEVNAKQEASIKSTQLGLWKRQQARMVLPEGLPHVEYDEKLKNDERELFRDAYGEEVRRVWKVLNPMDTDGTGVVNYPLPMMFKLLKQKPWINAPPKSETIWEVMEDLWLLEGLFESIAEANGGPDAGRPEACVHQIDNLELRGGGEKLSTGSSGGSDEGMMSGFGGAAGMGMGMGMGMGNRGGAGEMSGMPGMGGGGAASVPTVSAEFDVREEFGDDGSGSGVGGGSGGGGGGGPAGMMSAMSMMQGGAMGGMGEDGMGSGQVESVIKRYVTSDENLPYKTRGFYLSVKMDHRKIPQLIAELTANEKSVWPVQILRVQMSRLHEDDVTFSSGYSGGGGMRMGPGGPMGMGMGMGMAGSMGAGGPMSALGGVRDRDDEYDQFTNSRSFNNGNMSPQTMLKVKESQESLDIALRDPYMAQVTLCGVFTMYKKVEEPKEEAAPESTSAAGESEATEEAGSGEGDNPDAAASESAGPEMSDRSLSAEGSEAPEVLGTTETSEKAEMPGDVPEGGAPEAVEGAGDDSTPLKTDGEEKPENEEKS